MDFPLILLVVLLLAVAFSAAAAWLAVRRQRRRDLGDSTRAAEFARRASQGVWSGATVVSARTVSSHLGMGGRVLVELSLRVSLAGQEPYSAHTTWWVESGALPAVQPGQHLPVKIDPQDPSIVYPNLSGAEYVPRTQF